MFRKRKLIMKIIKIFSVMCFMSYTQAFAANSAPCETNESNCWQCGDNCVARLDSEGKMTVSGSGEMWNYNSIKDENEVWRSTAPWAYESIQSIEIGEGITQVGAYDFYMKHDVSNIILPESLKIIGSGAFLASNGPSEINLPDSLTRIGYGTFANNRNLTTIEIPDSVQYIDISVFHNDENLTAVYFGENSQLKEIGDKAFKNTPNLNSLILPVSVSKIAESAFIDSGITALYCTKAQIDNAICDAEHLGLSEDKIVHYEQKINAPYIK